MEEKKKKSFAGLVGTFMANAIVVCISTCLLSILIAIVYGFVSWVFRLGGII